MRRVVLLLVLLFMAIPISSFAQNNISAKDKCSSGDAKACVAYGKSEKNKNPDVAFKAFDKACKMNEAEGCFELMQAYDGGNGVKQNRPKAVEVGFKSCDELKHGNSCFILAYGFQNGLGYEKYESRAMEYYKKACDLGTQAGCDKIPKQDNVVLTPSPPAPVAVAKTKTADEIAQEACEKNDLSQCVIAGRSLLLNRNGKEAEKYLLKACDGKLVAGCVSLAIEYFYSAGVDYDGEKAFKYANMSCNMSTNGDGCGILGLMYLSGYNVDKSYTLAFKNLTLGCDFGLAQACEGLGTMYEEGLGVVRNHAKAKSYYSKACDSVKTLYLACARAKDENAK